METSRTFSGEIRLSTCAETKDLGEGITIRKETGREALDFLAEVLRAYGMSVEIEQPTNGYANVKIWHPEPYDAKSLRVRNPSGRPRKQADCSVSLEWLETHSVDEGMQALGCSRRTYYRRLREMRDSAGK